MVSRRVGRLLGLCLAAVLLSGCQEGAVQQKFASETQQRVALKAQTYPNEAYQSGEVPLKSYIKMAGTIIKTDAVDESQIGKSDRFVLASSGEDYQVINSTESVVALGDQVVVFGEYLGFIQGQQILVEGLSE